MHFEMFLTYGHLDMESFCDEFMDAKNLTSNSWTMETRLWIERMDIFGEVEINFRKSKNLLMLVSENQSVSCSNTFAERVFSALPSHQTDSRNCVMGA